YAYSARGTDWARLTHTVVNIAGTYEFTPTFTTAAGNLRVPLPFPQATGTQVIPVPYFQGLDLPAGYTSLALYIASSGLAGYANVWASGPDVPTLSVGAAHLVSGQIVRLRYSGTYRTVPA